MRMLYTPYLPILDANDRDEPPRPTPTESTDADLLDAYSAAVAGMIERVGPAVVRVETGAVNGLGRGGVGSGVIISPDGLIVTNSHVVGGAEVIRLADTEGRTTEAQLIGEDPDTDLALIRANAARDLPAAVLGDFEAVEARPACRGHRQPARFRMDCHRRRRLGARPVAPRPHRPHDRGRDPDGRRPQPGQFRRSVGVVPGEVIGINTAVIAGAQGISFAVASNTARFVLGEIVRHGRVRRGYIGVTAQTVPVPRRFALAASIPGSTGALLTSVDQAAAGAVGGLLRGDIVVAADGVPVTGVDDLIRILTAERIDRDVPIDVLRRGRLRNFTVAPTERPPEPQRVRSASRR